jgi:hypothetical protein
VLLGQDRHTLGPIRGFLVRELGRLIGGFGMFASRGGVLLASLVGAFAALFGGGSMTFGCSFMMVRSSRVGIFRHT